MTSAVGEGASVAGVHEYLSGGRRDPGTRMTGDLAWPPRLFGGCLSSTSPRRRGRAQRFCCSGMAVASSSVTFHNVLPYSRAPRTAGRHRRLRIRGVAGPCLAQLHPRRSCRCRRAHRRMAARYGSRSLSSATPWVRSSPPRYAARKPRRVSGLVTVSPAHLSFPGGDGRRVRARPAMDFYLRLYEYLRTDRDFHPPSRRAGATAPFHPEGRGGHPPQTPNWEPFHLEWLNAPSADHSQRPQFT